MSYLKHYIKNINNFLIDMFFPKFCFGCGKEKTYLCEDCRSTLEILENYFCLCKKGKRLLKIGKCKKCRDKKLNGLYFALPYQNPIAKKLIHSFKYEPFIKELKKDLTSLIITYFQLIEKDFSLFSDYILIPVPLAKKRLKWRGFNQSEEIGKLLSEYLKIILIKDALIKIKESLPQVKLTEQAREENIKNSFVVKNKEKIINKKILLIDDVYTTGSTMEECAQVLKKAGAKEVWGITIARG